MRPTVNAAPRFRAVLAGVAVAATVFSPLLPRAYAATPRTERVADRIAERRYARMSIAEARAARAVARVAEIAPVTPVPPPPRPATVRRLARAGVPLGGPTPPAVTAAPVPPPARIGSGRQPPRPLNAPPPAIAAPARPTAPATAATAHAAAPIAAEEPGAWTLDAEPGASPAAAEVAPDGTRSVLKAGGDPPSPQPARPPASSGPAVTQPPVELLPTPGAN